MPPRATESVHRSETTRCATFDHMQCGNEHSHSITSSARPSSGGEGKSERIRGLEVEDQLDFHCPLDRQFGWLLALKYPSGVDADYTVRVPKIGSVAHETARQRAFAPWVDRGYPVVCRQYGELFALAGE